MIRCNTTHTVGPLHLRMENTVFNLRLDESVDVKPTDTEGIILSLSVWWDSLVKPVCLEFSKDYNYAFIVF